MWPMSNLLFLEKMVTRTAYTPEKIAEFMKKYSELQHYLIVIDDEERSVSLRKDYASHALDAIRYFRTEIPKAVRRILFRKKGLGKLEKKCDDFISSWRL